MEKRNDNDGSTIWQKVVYKAKPFWGYSCLEFELRQTQACWYSQDMLHRENNRTFFTLLPATFSDMDQHIQGLLAADKPTMVPRDDNGLHPTDNGASCSLIVDCLHRENWELHWSTNLLYGQGLGKANESIRRLIELMEDLAAWRD